MRTEITYASSLRVTQLEINNEKVQKFVVLYTNGLLVSPTYVLDDWHMEVVDGHHRSLGAYLADEDRQPVYVLEKDEDLRACPQTMIVKDSKGKLTKLKEIADAHNQLAQSYGLETIFDYTDTGSHTLPEDWHTKPMIHAVCLNPTLDVTGDLKIPGGKGMNVARELRRIYYGKYCLYSFKGSSETGADISYYLDEKEIPAYLRPIGGRNVRVHIVGVDAVKRVDRHNPKVTDEEKLDLEERLFTGISRNRRNVLVLSGSLPRNYDPNIFAEYIGRAREIRKNVVTIVDSSDLRVLEHTLAMTPDFIKPNRQEFEALLGTSPATLEDYARQGQQLLERGLARNILLSLDVDGAMIITKKGTYYAKNLDVPVVCRVGAGDTATALLAASVGMSPVQQLRRTMAAAQSHVQHPGNKGVHRQEYLKFLPHIEITRM